CAACLRWLPGSPAPPPEAPVNVSVIAPSGAVLHNVLEVHAVIGPAGTPRTACPSPWPSSAPLVPSPRAILPPDSVAAGLRLGAVPCSSLQDRTTESPHLLAFSPISAYPRGNVSRPVEVVDSPHGAEGPRAK